MERVDYSDPITLQAKEKAAIEKQMQEGLKNVNTDPLSMNFALEAKKSGRSWMNPVQNQPDPVDVPDDDDQLDELTKSLDNPTPHF